MAANAKPKVKNNIQHATDIADECREIFDATQSLNAALTAIKGYNSATSAARTQLIYKKLTGAPIKIEFLED